jgi:hypothetical protein
MTTKTKKTVTKKTVTKKTVTKKTAKLLKTGLLQGNANLYRLSVPLEGSEFVVVSAIIFFGKEETYIFPSTKEGRVRDWMELPGSFKGEQDHGKALQNAGYEVVNG